MAIHSFKAQRDYLSVDGAAALAEKLRDFWLDQGAKVHARVEYEDMKGGGTVPVIRSDLINGLPRRVPS